MKILFYILTIFMFSTECDQNKSTEDTTTALNSENTSKMQESTTLIYEATTRGFYEKIWITKDSITVTNDRNQIDKIRLSTPENGWNEIMSLLDEVDVKSLPNLEAPTTLRHHDGAAFATLTIVQNKVETKSETFDHGHPPVQIETLVNKVLSMRELLNKR